MVFPNFDGAHRGQQHMDTAEDADDLNLQAAFVPLREDGSA